MALAKQLRLKLVLLSLIEKNKVEVIAVAPLELLFDHLNRIVVLYVGLFDVGYEDLNILEGGHSGVDESG